MNQRLKLYTFDNYYEQWRAARYVSNRYHNTSSVTDMMSDLNWAPLEVCRIRYRLIFFYKVMHHLVAIPYSNLLIPVDTRTRHTNPNSFRHIQTSKDCYKYSYFPRSITLWNQLPYVNILSVRKRKTDVA
jgi:hypothetical protein